MENTPRSSTRPPTYARSSAVTSPPRSAKQTALLFCTEVCIFIGGTPKAAKRETAAALKMLVPAEPERPRPKSAEGGRWTAGRAVARPAADALRPRSPRLPRFLTSPPEAAFSRGHLRAPRGGRGSRKQFVLVCPEVHAARAAARRPRARRVHRGAARAARGDERREVRRCCAAGPGAWRGLGPDAPRPEIRRAEEGSRVQRTYSKS